MPGALRSSSGGWRAHQGSPAGRHLPSSTSPRMGTATASVGACWVCCACSTPEAHLEILQPCMQPGKLGSAMHGPSGAGRLFKKLGCCSCR